jgi:hypothetical protein
MVAAGIGEGTVIIPNLGTRMKQTSKIAWVGATSCASQFHRNEKQEEQ